MNRSIHFFDYKQCFKRYIKRIETIRQHRVRGEIIVAKPVLMVALIDVIGNDVFTNN